jgi:membrane protease YdiL (CAAX protease family)
LYLVGWLGTVFGLVLIAVALLARGGVAAGALLATGLLVLGGALVAAAGSQAMERRAKGVEGYAGPSPWLVFAASLPLTILTVLAVVLPLGGGQVAPVTPLTTLVSVIATGLVYIALVRLLIVGTGSLSWSEMGFSRRGIELVEDVAWGAALALPVVLVTLIVAGALVGLFGVTPDSPLPPSIDTSGLILNFFAAAIAAPTGEEVFFRGFATTAWARTAGSRGAIIRGAIFFALVHIVTVEGDWREAVVAFGSRVPVALALGWIFLSRRSIYASISMHATFNAVVLVLAELGASVAE